MFQGKDKNDLPVCAGDKVKLLQIRPSILKRLKGSELTDVSSLLNKVVGVFDVDDDGQVWVSMEWDRGNGRVEIHSIAVDSNTIEFVQSNPNTN